VEVTVCDQVRRDGSVVCIVEQAVDVLMLGGQGFTGHYHVLYGRLSPIDGMGAEHKFCSFG